MLAAEAAPAQPVSLEPAVASAALSVDETATVDETAMVDEGSTEGTFVLASVSATAMPDVEDSEPNSDAAPRATHGTLVSFFKTDLGDEVLKPVARPIEETLNECLVAEICIDDYLWALYERTPKVDTNKITERVKATVKIKGKTRTITKTVTKYVLGDFTWKDPIAAQKVGMSLKDYVIGGMDRSFKQKLHHAMRQMDEAGFAPGITSAFRDDYRQAIAVGKKAASDSSYHGGSRRGGYGRGLAADIVSTKGTTRSQRFASTVEMWKWVDQNEKRLGVGRPYLDRDPPHVGPLDGKEFVAKRGGGRTKVALQTKKPQKVAALAKPQRAAGPTKPAPTAGVQTKIAQAAGSPAKNAQQAAVVTKKPRVAARSVAAQRSAPSRQSPRRSAAFKHRRVHSTDIARANLRAGVGHRA